MKTTPRNHPRRPTVRGSAVLAIMTTAVLAAVTLSGCVTRETVVVRPQAAAQPAVVRHMPPPIHEDRGQPPAPGFGWVPGHWKWEGSDWAWVHGQWIRQVVPPMPPVIVEQITIAPSPQHYWVPGHWVWRMDGNAGWVWIAGSWHR